jgi:hypothetical protein
MQMSNRHNLVLYIDKELVEKSKELGFNLSKTFENHLNHSITQFSTCNSLNHFISAEKVVRLPEFGPVEFFSFRNLLDCILSWGEKGLREFDEIFEESIEITIFILLELAVVQDLSCSPDT